MCARVHAYPLSMLCSTNNVTFIYVRLEILADTLAGKSGLHTPRKAALHSSITTGGCDKPPFYIFRTNPHMTSSPVTSNGFLHWRSGARCACLGGLCASEGTWA